METMFSHSHAMEALERTSTGLSSMLNAHVRFWVRKMTRKMMIIITSDDDNGDDDNEYD